MIQYFSLEFLQSTIQILELQNLADEEVSVAVGDLRVSDVNHVLVDVEVQLRSRLEFPFQAAAALCPDDVVHLVFEAQQLSRQLRDGTLVVAFAVALILVHERGEFRERQSRVKLQIRANCWQFELLLDLVHEDLCLMFQWLLDVVINLAIEWWRAWRHKFGACEHEEVPEHFHVAALHLVHVVVVVLLAQYLLDGLIDALRVEHQADGQQVIHLLGLLVDLIVLVRARAVQLLRALNVQQDGCERSDGIGVAAHHHVSEADVVGC